MFQIHYQNKRCFDGNKYTKDVNVYSKYLWPHFKTPIFLADVEKLPMPKKYQPTDLKLQNLTATYDIIKTIELSFHTPQPKISKKNLALTTENFMFIPLINAALTKIALNELQLYRIYFKL